MQVCVCVWKSVIMGSNCLRMNCHGTTKMGCTHYSRTGLIYHYFMHLCFCYMKTKRFDKQNQIIQLIVLLTLTNYLLGAMVMTL